MWLEIQLDDLSTGDFLEIIDSDGLTLMGYLRVIRWSQRSLVIDMPLEGFEGDEIGAMMTTEVVIETRDVRRIAKWHPVAEAAE